jgi:predicted dehydrogenase/nucleoside-diphosphate-sugar epimerase
MAMPSTTPTGLASRNTRVAVVGAGFIADFHLEILRGTEGVELVAVCDSDLARAESLARKWQVARAVRSLQELRGLSIDVAHVLVPPNLHFSVARELLEGGIGVLVEKPLALSTADAHELGRIARERQLVLGVNHNAVHHPAFAKLLARVRAGEIGRVEHVRACLSVPLRQLDVGDFSAWMFREPRNIVFEQAPHPFAQIVELAGAPRRVATNLLASRELQPGQTFHERWVISGAAEHATVELFLHFGAAFTRSTFEVLGSDGSLEADLFHNHLAGERKTLYLDFWNSFLAGWRRGGELKRSARGVLIDYLKLTLGLGQRQDAFFAGMRASIRAFHAALRAGEPPPVDAARGALVLEWCERATEHVPSSQATAIELPAPGKARAGEVVVLGATGFIGNRVLAKLLERGAPVTAVVRRTHSLPPLLVDAARRGEVRLVRASLEDPAALATALQGAKCVLQLATGNGHTWEAVERAMVKGSAAIARTCVDAKVERYVFCSSTAALYLGAGAQPQPVEDSLEADPQPEKRSLYARGKIATERELVKLMRESGLPLVIVRPGVVLGRGTALQHSGLGLWARDNHCVGWGRGDNALPLVWVDDVADALVAIALFKGRELDGKELNLAANTGLSAAEVVAEMRRASGRDLHFHPRALGLSQSLEIGKWLVKKVGGRKDAAFPSWRDLSSRSLAAPLSCRTAREVLGWRPVDERERFLELAVRSMCGDRRDG